MVAKQIREEYRNEILARIIDLCDVPEKEE
jgi:hypothetical protein